MLKPLLDNLFGRAGRPDAEPVDLHRAAIDVAHPLREHAGLALGSAG